MGGQSVIYVQLIVVFAFFSIIFAIGIFQQIIRPLFIPKAEIERLARELIAKYPDNPEQAAWNEEFRAWRNSDSYAQGKWKRVRRSIQPILTR